MENFILVAENVVVDVKHLRRLSSEDKRLHETPHRTHVIGQLASYLNKTTNTISVTKLIWNPSTEQIFKATS